MISDFFSCQKRNEASLPDIIMGGVTGDGHLFFLVKNRRIPIALLKRFHSVIQSIRKERRLLY